MRKLAVGHVVAVISVVAAIAAGCAAPATQTPTPVAPSPPPASSPPSASADPSWSAEFPAWYSSGGSSGAGVLPEGTHATGAFLPKFTYSVPVGWVNDADDPGFYALFPDTPTNQAEFARSGNLAELIHMGLSDRPYFACKSWEDNHGTTAAEISAAVAANDALAVSGLADVSIGGLIGKQFDVRLDPVMTETCPGDPPDFDLGDTRARVVLLDIPGRGVLVIIMGSTYSADFDTFLAGAMPVVESFAFDVQG